MKLNISIEYRTNWGEEIVLCLGGKRYPLSYVAEGIWQGEIARFNPEKASEYGYEVVRDGQTVPCHPTQIYEMIYCIVGFIVTWLMYWKGQAYKREGLLLGVFLEIIFFTRFMLEFIKNDQELFEADHLLNMGQLLSLPFIIWGIYLIIRAYRRPIAK